MGGWGDCLQVIFTVLSSLFYSLCTISSPVSLENHLHILYLLKTSQNIVLCAYNIFCLFHRKIFIVGAYVSKPEVYPGVYRGIHLFFLIFAPKHRLWVL